MNTQKTPAASTPKFQVVDGLVYRLNAAGINDYEVVVNQVNGDRHDATSKLALANRIAEFLNGDM
jgi:hypothetical protein